MEFLNISKQHKELGGVLIFLVCFMFQIQASAEMRSKHALKIERTKTQLSATLAEGYHFNLKAPNQILTKGKALLPSSAGPNLTRFSWPKANSTNGQLQLYVCDNANTYCETHEIELSQKAGLSVPPPEDKLQAILARAKKNKKLVLLDFSARWCPACVRIETEILPRPEFKNAARGFEMVKIDVDLFDNFPLSQKYQVKGIPTLLILDSEGREIDRILDFQTLPVIAKFLASAAQNNQPLDKLADELATELSKENSDAKVLDAELRARPIARRLLASNRPLEALKILETLSSPPIELAQARVAAAAQEYAKNPLMKTKFLETLNRELASEPESLRSLSWRAELMGLLDSASPASKKLLAEGTSLAEVWLTDEKKLAAVLKDEDLGEYAGYERLLVATSLGDLLEASGATAGVAWKRAVEIGEGYHLTAKQPGPARRFLLLLVQAKEYSKADTLSLALLKTEPHNFDVRRRRVKILAAQNRHEEASVLAKSLLQEAEGRNQFWVAESLAESYLALKKDKEALAILDQFLSRKELNLESMKKTKKSFESLRAKIVL